MIQVLLFAQLQETVGQNKLSIEQGHVTTVSSVKDYLLNKHPELQLDDVLVAVNEVYAKDEVVVQAGDTIAFIPPVSGG